MSRSGNYRGYAISRNALIDAVRSLETLPHGSYILVGAQAVYLRAPEPIAFVAAFTFDGDLLVDPAIYVFRRETSWKH